MSKENKIIKSKNALCLLFKEGAVLPKELQYIKENFCGKVVEHPEEIGNDSSEKKIYVCGDLDQLKLVKGPLFVLKEFSTNYENFSKTDIHFVELGEIPVLIENVGVYFRSLFKAGDFFNKIKEEHEFQDLTESNKPGKALRKGIYSKSQSQ